LAADSATFAIFNSQHNTCAVRVLATSLTVIEVIFNVMGSINPRFTLLTLLANS